MFRSVKLSMKLALGFGLVLVVFVTAVMISWLQIGRVEEGSRFLNKVTDAQNLMSELESDVAKARFEVRDYMYSENPDSLKRAREVLGKAKAHIEEGKRLYASEPRLIALKSLSDMDAPPRSILQKRGGRRQLDGGETKESPRAYGRFHNLVGGP